MHKICLIISFLFLYSGLNAQNIVGKGNTLPLVGYWSVGTTKNVKSVNTTTQVKGSKTTIANRKTESTWKVVDSTDKSYVIHYTMNSFSSDQTSDSFLMAFAQVFKGITMKYCTNEVGIFDSIINIKEISTLCNNGLDNAIKSMKWPDNNYTKEVKSKLKEMLGDLFTFKASLEEELHVIHYFYGLEYQLSKLYTYDYELPSLIGGENYPSKLKMKMSSLTPAADKVKLTGTIIPNPETYHNIAFKNLSNYCEYYGLPKPKKTDIAMYSSTHKIESTYSMTEAWPMVCTYIKINTSDKSKTTETLTISFN